MAVADVVFVDEVAEYAVEMDEVEDDEDVDRLPKEEEVGRAGGDCEAPWNRGDEPHAVLELLRATRCEWEHQTQGIWC